MKLKKTLTILSILSIVFLTGCWSRREINTLAITVCTGIDKSEEGYLLTQQIINPKSIKNSSSEAPIILYSQTGDDLFEIKRKLTTEISREIYDAHLRMVVIGEDVAEEGIQDIIDFFSRGSEYRTDFYFVIAKNATANKVLSTLTALESIPGIGMYKSLDISEKTWAPTKSIRIIELMNEIIADGKNPVLSGIELTGGSSESNSTDVLRKSNQDRKLKYTGLGAFNNDKLVGWLNEDESKGFNYIIGNIKNTVGHVNYGDKVKITVEIIKSKSNMKVFLIDGKPTLELKINIKQNVSAVEGKFDVSKEQNIKTLNEITENKVKLVCEQALNKAKYELKTDIFGFGEKVHKKYPKVWQEIKDDWNTEFIDLPVNIVVKVETNNLGQMTKPFFIKEKE